MFFSILKNNQSDSALENGTILFAIFYEAYNFTIQF